MTKAFEHLEKNPWFLCSQSRGRERSSRRKKTSFVAIESWCNVLAIYRDDNNQPEVVVLLIVEEEVVVVVVVLETTVPLAVFLAAS